MLVKSLAYYVGCLALGGWLASEKGYSVGSWVTLLFLFGVIALIVLVGAPDKKSQEQIKEQNNLLKYSPKEILPTDSKKCPYCAENIKTEAKICPHCGKNIQQYEEDEKKQREQKNKEVFKNLEDLLNDENIMKHANELRRMYGKGAYIRYLKSQAKELGFGDINITEDDIK